MYVVCVPGFVFAVPASRIAEPAWFEHYELESDPEWPAGSFSEPDPRLEAALHLSGVRAYLDYGAL